MNDTSRSNRYHIGLFGRRNVGKSSLINAIVGQEISIVSDIPGTTTDTVYKNIELPDIGAAVFCDTAGYDDYGCLGIKRVEQVKKAIQRIDVALILLDNNPENAIYEKEWQKIFNNLNIPVIYVLSKSDNVKILSNKKRWEEILNAEVFPVSSKTGEGKNKLLNKIAVIHKTNNDVKDITYSLVKPGDVVLLIMPQDIQAPSGRLIQPQVQTLRNLLDKHCLVMCCTPEELPQMLKTITAPPNLIITDSQVFKKVEKLLPSESKLTSFSILMARYKGDIETFKIGAEYLLKLPYNGRILIAEACSHIPQNEDIGRVKLPRLLREKFGNEITIDIVSGNDFPKDLTSYNIIIHCGACMFTRRHVLTRIHQAKEQNIPITNYGIAIAALTGIIDKVSL